MQRTTIHLTGPAPRKLDRLTPIILIALVLILAAGLTAASKMTVKATPEVAYVYIATPVPSVPLVEPAPQAQQVAAQLPAAAPRYVPVWAAPDGAVLGSIPWSSESPMLGRYGDGWVLTNWRDSQVWVRAADIGVSLANLAPSAPSAPSAPAPATAPVAADQVYQPASTVEPPTAPQAAAPLELTADQQAALDRQFADVSDADRARSFDEHTAQQAAWCEGRASGYCDMVRAGQ